MRDMPTRINHIFFLKRGKNNSETISIYLRIIVDGKRAELSTGIKILRVDWVSKAGRARGNDKIASDINTHLNVLETKVYDAYNKFIGENRCVTAHGIKQAITGADSSKYKLISIFQKHNAEIAVLVPSQYSPATLERYKTSLSHTQKFLEWKYYVSDIDIWRIDSEFISSYDFFLKSVRKCSNNTTIKYLKNFKKIIRICIANGWLDKDPFLYYKPRYKEVNRVILDEQEIQIIGNKQFTTERLTAVRDIFLFSCFTGLAYAEVKKLSKQNIFIGIDSKKWISIRRTKTGSVSNIPILPTALQILDKYSEYQQCNSYARLLPVLSNQKMNSYLKEIADVCQIPKELTFHCARHTFATTVTLNNNISIESVSKMLGHKNITTTQLYAKLSDKKVSHDMKPLFLKFKIKDG